MSSRTRGDCGLAAYLIGRGEDRVEAWTRAHHERIRLGDAARAARCAFWLAFGLLHTADLARGGGWVDPHRFAAALGTAVQAVRHNVCLRHGL